MNQIVELDSKVDLKIIPSAPFSFDGTIHKASHFPTPDNFYEQTYWQTLHLGGRFYGLKFINAGTIDHPGIILSVYYDSTYREEADLDAISVELDYRFDLRSDLTAFTSHFGSDPLLGPVIERWRGMRVSTPYSLYEFAVITTVLQNTVVRRSVQMMESLFRNYGTLVRFDGKELFAFWKPEKLDNVNEEELRALKVGYRAKNLKRQATNFVSAMADEKLWRTLDKETLKKKLLTIYGIGPATVQYMLFEVFHHYDACEYIPPWEQKIYSRLLFDSELVDASVLLQEIGQRFGQWKMLAMHYIFEDLFWQRKNTPQPWLERLIRL